MRNVQTRGTGAKDVGLRKSKRNQKTSGEVCAGSETRKTL